MSASDCDLKEYWRADNRLAHRCPKCGRPADGAWRETVGTQRTVTYDPCRCEAIEPSAEPYVGGVQK